MTCPEHDVLVALGDGELSESHARSVRAHAADCTRCRSELAELATLAEDLRAPVPGALGRQSAEAFADGVLAKLDVETTPRRAFPRWAGALALAAALPLAFLASRLAPTLRGEGEWTARGGASASPVARTLVRFGRVAGTTFEPIADGTKLDADALLTAEVGGVESQRYLLAFLVDAAGERHWIAPSYEPGAPPPSSIALPVSLAPRVLGSMVRLDRPARGPARLVAIVLDQSESVEHVEHARIEELSSEQLASHYPRALVVTTRVEIP